MPPRHLLYERRTADEPSSKSGALVDFVRSGGGFLGIHSATDTFYSWLRIISIWSAAILWSSLALGSDYRGGWPWWSTRGVSRQLGANRGRDLSNQRLRLSRITRAPAPWPKLGKPEHEGGASTFLRLALGLDSVVWRGRFYMALGHEAAVWRDPRYQRILLNALLWARRRSS